MGLGKTVMALALISLDRIISLSEDQVRNFRRLGGVEPPRGFHQSKFLFRVKTRLRGFWNFEFPVTLENQQARVSSKLP